MIPSFLRSAALALILPAMASAQTAAPVIEVAPAQDGLTIAGHVNGLGEGSVTAMLTIRKSDSSGEITTSQQRTLTVSAGSRDTVASTALSADPGARIEIEMTLTENGTEIGRSRTVLGAKD